MYESTFAIFLLLPFLPAIAKTSSRQFSIHLRTAYNNNFESGNSSIYTAYAHTHTYFTLSLTRAHTHISNENGKLGYLQYVCVHSMLFSLPFIFPHCRLLIRIRTLRPATLLSNMYFVYSHLALALFLSFSRIFRFCISCSRQTLSLTLGLYIITIYITRKYFYFVPAKAYTFLHLVASFCHVYVESFRSFRIDSGPSMRDA